MTTIEAAKREQKNEQLINSFYSPSFTDDGNEQYQYAHYKVLSILGSTIIPAHPSLAYLSGRFLGTATRG